MIVKCLGCKKRDKIIAKRDKTIEKLQMKIDKFNGNLPTVIKGSDAEKFLAKLLKGKLPGNGKPYDLELTRKGKTVTAEVKYSNANTSVPTL